MRESERKLTEAQQKLIYDSDNEIDNRRLVYYVYNNIIYFKNREFAEEEDVLSVGMLALTRAAMHFDESKCTKFSTYATTYIRNAMIKYICNQYKKLKLNISLETPLCTVGDTVYTPEDAYMSKKNASLNANEIDISKLDKNEKRIIELRYKGYTFKEIGEVFGVSRQRIHQIHKDIQNKLIEYKEYCY